MMEELKQDMREMLDGLEIEQVKKQIEEAFSVDIPINAMAAIINYWINRQGFWDSANIAAGYEVDETVQWLTDIKLSKHALITTEVAELTEAVRHGNPASEHIPDFTAEEEELADIIIRTMDYAAQFDYRLEEAIAAKMLYNLGRPHKHGKQA